MAIGRRDLDWPVETARERCATACARELHRAATGCRAATTRLRSATTAAATAFRPHPVRAMRAARPGLQVIALVDASQEEEVLAYARAGVMGYFTHDSEPSQIVAALLDGGPYVAQPVATVLLRKVAHSDESEFSAERLLTPGANALGVFGGACSWGLHGGGCRWCGRGVDHRFGRGLGRGVKSGRCS